MTPDDRRAQLRLILDAHDAAVREFRHESFAATLAHLRATLAAMQQSLTAQERAIDAITTANRAALALFNESAPET